MRSSPGGGPSFEDASLSTLLGRGLLHLGPRPCTPARARLVEGGDHGGIELDPGRGDQVLSWATLVVRSRSAR
jgi:hypothetical protein